MSEVVVQTESIENLQKEILSLAQEWRNADKSEEDKENSFPIIVQKLTQMYNFYGNKTRSEQEDIIHMDTMKKIIKQVAKIWTIIPEGEQYDDEEDEEYKDDETLEKELESSLWDTISSEEIRQLEEYHKQQKTKKTEEIKHYVKKETKKEQKRRDALKIEQQMNEIKMNEVDNESEDLDLDATMKPNDNDEEEDDEGDEGDEEDMNFVVDDPVEL